MAENIVSPYADLLIEGGNKNVNRTQVTGFISIHQNADDLIFFDARIMKNFSRENHKNTKKIYECNIGPGYRYIIDKNLVIGGATFFDYRNSLIDPKKGFKQATINIHALTDTWQGQLNLYIALDSKNIQKQHQSFTGKASIKGDKIALINLNQIQQEKNSTGIDIDLSRSIPNLEQLRIGSTLYSFKSGIKEAKNIVGFGLDTQYCIK